MLLRSRTLPFLWCQTSVSIFVTSIQPLAPYVNSAVCSFLASRSRLCYLEMHFTVITRRLPAARVHARVARWQFLPPVAFDPTETQRTLEGWRKADRGSLVKLRVTPGNERLHPNKSIGRPVGWSERSFLILLSGASTWVHATARRARRLFVASSASPIAPSVGADCSNYTTEGAQRRNEHKSVCLLYLFCSCITKALCIPALQRLSEPQLGFELWTLSSPLGTSMSTRFIYGCADEFPGRKSADIVLVNSALTRECVRKGTAAAKNSWSVETIQKTTHRLCLNFGVFDFFPFFYKDVLSQALSEDAAWDFLIIFKNDFYSIFSVLIFYFSFQ